MSFIIQEIPQPTVFGIATVEETAGAGGTIDFYLGEQDQLVFNGDASANWVLDVVYDATTSLDVAMQNGDVAEVSVVAKNGGTAYRQTQFKIDGTSSGIEFTWLDNQPSAGTTNSVNIYDYEIIKVNTNQWQVYGKFTKNVPDYITAPSAPIMGSATLFNSSGMEIFFSAPSSTGGSPIIEYIATSNPSGITATSSASPIVISGLTVNATYNATVQAVNIFGGGANSAASNNVTLTIPASQQAYTTPGTYSWVAPAGVDNVSIVAVGGGSSKAGAGIGNTAGGGGGGGALAYKNSITVSPGSSYTVVVGVGGNNSAGGNSSFTASFGTCTAQGGQYGPSYFDSGPGGVPQGTFDGGGNGGTGGTFVSGPNPGRAGGGGGAGGYSGNGGNGGRADNAILPTNGAGGGGGGAYGFVCSANDQFACGGGGVGILGQGSSGNAGGSTSEGGFGGSGGTQGGAAGSGSAAGMGGSYGAGAGGASSTAKNNTGGAGAVRIIWPGTTGITRAFPSTNTGDL